MRALLAMHWRFYVADEAFVTCDNPVLNAGLHHPGGELAMVLGRSVALVATHTPSFGPLYRPATADIVDKLNRRTIANAIRFIFSHRNDPALQRLIVDVVRSPPA